MSDQQLFDCQILYHLGYWDGPESGVLVHNNEICYFDLAKQYHPKVVKKIDDDNGCEYEDCDWGEFRRYNVYSLSSDDKLRLSLFHSLFQICVGFHTDYFPLNGRGMHPARQDQTINCLHYAAFLDKFLPAKDEEFIREDGKKRIISGYWGRYMSLKEELKQQIGEFKKENATLIGWIYYRQLFGIDEKSEKEQI